MLKQLKYLRKIDWLYVIVGAFFIFWNVWFELEIPDYMMQITQKITAPGGTIKDILEIGAKMLGLAVASMACIVVSKYFISIVSSSLGRNIRSRVFGKVMGFSTAEIKHFSTASLITRTTNDITQVQNLLAMGMQILIKAPMMSVLAIVRISESNIAWTFATASAVAFIMIIITIIIFVALPKFKRIQTLTDNMNRITREGLTGARVVRAFNGEDYQSEKFEKANSEITNNHLFTSRVMSLMDPAMNLIMSGLPLAIYLIGAIIISGAGWTDKLLTFAKMTTFSSYAIHVVMSFVLLIMIFIMLPRAQVSARRINEILDTPSTIVDGKGTDKPIKVGEVQFVNVGFKYPDAEEYVLQDISFKAEKGQTIAFIGSTGSGKSTLINLVPRLYDATEGQVIVDGVNVKDYKLSDLNNKIGYISQKAVLFSGTVESNVTMGEKEGTKPTEEDVERALDISQSHFVNKLEDGVKSRIDQGGRNVSGGQKQRISIARALARKPEILIFDDSFSALDYKTDKMLRAALKEKADDVTRLIVAQRIGTIKDADKIIVLDNGKIVGEGKHDELMKHCSVYKEIALSQLSKEELKNA